MELRVAFLGFGNVGKALAELLLEKEHTLKEDYDLTIVPVGIGTRSHGFAVSSKGVDLTKALELTRRGDPLDALHRGNPIEQGDTTRFLAEIPADLMFETTPTNPTNGQPALAYIHGILERGIHVVTANKGPVAFGYETLTALAERKEVGFLFESTVMDGAPVLAVGREGLPGTRIERIRAIFNSTTNYIITRMEQDSISFDEALKAAQEIGIAETDPTLDIDGWDSAIKTVIVANVLMGGSLHPADVDRTGIRTLTLTDIKDAAANGQRIRLMCEATRHEDGTIRASVTPEHVPADSTLAGITGTSSIIDFETDTLSKLSLIENDPGPDTTAYGMYADMLNILRGRERM